ncbi:helix-turn-helix domain-containing protein [Hungatella hathewayi]
MTSKKNDNTIIELYRMVDCVKDIDENISLFSKIIEKFSNMFNEYYNKRKRQKQKELILKYKKSLLDFQELIEEQLSVIEGLSEDEEPVKKILDLKEQIIDYSLKNYIYITDDVSDVLNNEEVNIYTTTALYKIIDKYFSINELQLDKTASNSMSINWKKYFFFIICLDKSSDFNYKILVDYNKRNNLSNDILLKKRSDYYIDEFQGQLSKYIHFQRKKMNLTQKQLSELSGIDRTMITKIESVNQPTTLETAIKLLSPLNMGLVISPFSDDEIKINTHFNMNYIRGQSNE